MKYEREVWKTLSERFGQMVENEIISVGRRIGFKKPKGDINMPSSMVKEMMEEAYRRGAEQALKMAEEVDG